MTIDNSNCAYAENYQNKPNASTINDSVDLDKRCSSAEANAIPSQLHTTPSQRANSSPLAVLNSSEFDVMATLGGIRGIVEAVAPTVVFLIAFILSDRAVLSALIATGVSALAIIVRLLQGSPAMPAVGGALAMALSAFLAWHSGESQDVFLWGIIVNALYCGVLLISVLVRRPLIGIFVAMLRGEGMAWASDPQYREIRQRYTTVTWLWVAMFALRLVVQLPLYFTAATEALGIAKLVLGLPLFLLTVWASWLLLRKDPH